MSVKNKFRYDMFDFPMVNPTVVAVSTSRVEAGRSRRNASAAGYDALP